MNQRNAIIARYNPRSAINSVNDKLETKRLLAAAGVPVPQTLGVIRTREELRSFDFGSLPDAWVVKPNHGRRGEGVVLIEGRESEGWRQPDGRIRSTEQIRNHVSHILDGEMSLESAHDDAALFEPLIRTHPEFAGLVPFGLPDIRIVCFRNVPLMAMARLPTHSSGGRGNLHQGGVGAAIDFAEGRIYRAVQGSTPIEVHPSTGKQLIGLAIPFWTDLVEAACRCSEPLGLGYIGVDLVIDAAAGVRVLECNAFPGLEIQNVNGAGLADRLAKARRKLEPRRNVLARLLGI